MHTLSAQELQLAYEYDKGSPRWQELDLRKDPINVGLCWFLFLATSFTVTNSVAAFFYFKDFIWREINDYVEQNVVSGDELFSYLSPFNVYK